MLRNDSVERALRRLNAAYYGTRASTTRAPFHGARAVRLRVPHFAALKRRNARLTTSLRSIFRTAARRR
eukprot:4175782-Lingulodinium_polyedra.AAC.1